MTHPTAWRSSAACASHPSRRRAPPARSRSAEGPPPSMAARVSRSEADAVHARSSYLGWPELSVKRPIRKQALARACLARYAGGLHSWLNVSAASKTRPILLSYWVAVPQALRARRPNTRGRDRSQAVIGGRLAESTPGRSGPRSTRCAAAAPSAAAPAWHCLRRLARTPSHPAPPRPPRRG
jgi:hypothetical protein